MTFLPIVERELRVAARKRSTFWLRVAAALASVIIGSGLLLLGTVAGTGGATMGGVLFGTLTWLSLAAVLAAGLFLTSDCLSEEKREGTLGFLFLTDLRGYDVAGGKLLASSLRSFFALLAVVPILAVTLLMGGVTGAQFWKTSLALLNALFCSLVAGLFVSALSRDSQKALAGTLLLLLLWTAGGPLADLVSAGIHRRSPSANFCIFSPVYVFAMAGAWGRTLYWSGLLICQVVAWLLFGLACALVPRMWQEKTARVLTSTRSWAYRWRHGGNRRRARLRRTLIERNPVLWLACRERWQSAGLWVIALLASGGFALLFSKLPPQAWMIWGYLGGLFMLVLYLGAASQACRFFIEARRSGLTELLLATPLQHKQIVQGQWRALLRMFGPPVLLLVCLYVTGSALSQQSWGRMTRQMRTTTSSVSSATNAQATSVVVVSSGPSPATLAAGNTAIESAVMILTLVAIAVSTLGNLVAIGWFGMWMGMTSRTAILATLKTFAFVQVIPWFGIYFASMMASWLVVIPGILKGGSSTQTIFWYPAITTALVTALSLGKDIGFFLWARGKLNSSFRDQAAQILGQPRPVLPPPKPADVAAPPVIAAPP